MKKTIYIFSDGELRRKDNTVYFENEEGKKFIPVENTKEICVFGEVDVNKRFLEFLTQSEIIMHFFQSLWILCRHILSEGTYEFRIYDTETGRKLSKF